MIIERSLWNAATDLCAKQVASNATNINVHEKKKRQQTTSHREKLFTVGGLGLNEIREIVLFI